VIRKRKNKGNEGILVNHLAEAQPLLSGAEGVESHMVVLCLCFLSVVAVVALMKSSVYIVEKMWSCSKSV